MSHEVYALAERVVEERAALAPDGATFGGVTGYDDRWPDLSPDGADHHLSELKRMMADIEALPDADDQWSRLAVRAMREDIARDISWFERGEHWLALNSVACPLQNLRTAMDVADTETAEGWEAAAARLEAMAATLAGYQARLDEARRSDNTVARRQVEAAIEQARAFGGPESSLMTMPAALAGSGIGDETLARRIEDGARSACAAFLELGEFLEKCYLPSAQSEDPVGAERYVPLAEGFLGGQIDPRETYEWGWEEVERIRSEMAEVANEILPGASIPEVIDVLQSDPARASADRTDFVRVMTDRQLQAVTDLDGTVFDIPEPVKEVTVQISPPGGSLGAYYIGPSEDWSRAGSVWFSLDPDEHQVAYYSQVSTNYHEGFPGHHLQSGVQMALADKLSRYSRTWIWYSGYGEGWALYSERLMHELGYFEKPEYVFGMLAESMLRACRVVIDIGSHLGLRIPNGQPFHSGESWTFETGVQMLMDYATQEKSYAESEMTRYLGWPGQAISYKVGERMILDMREQLRRQKGDDFDLKEFHARVLAAPVGLDHLRDVILGD